jgi:hypothetical protein
MVEKLNRRTLIFVVDADPISCDNMSSMKIAKNPIFHARTKHIECHYHFVREKVLFEEVELIHVPIVIN